MNEEALIAKANEMQVLGKRISILAAWKSSVSDGSDVVGESVARLSTLGMPSDKPTCRAIICDGLREAFDKEINATRAKMLELAKEMAAPAEQAIAAAAFARDAAKGGGE